MIFQIFLEIFRNFRFFHDFHEFFMKNQKFPKSSKFFAFYLESSKNVLPLRNPLGSARPTQHWPWNKSREIWSIWAQIWLSDLSLIHQLYSFKGFWWLTITLYWQCLKGSVQGGWQIWGGWLQLPLTLRVFRVIQNPSGFEVFRQLSHRGFNGFAWKRLISEKSLL